MVPRTLVVSIATPSRNVQGRVGPTHAEMTVVGPTVSIIAGCLHFFQLVERHEVHAIHGTGHNGVFDIKRRALLIGPGPAAIFDHLER